MNFLIDGILRVNKVSVIVVIYFRDPGFKGLLYFLVSDHDECNLKDANMCRCASGINCGAECINTLGSFKCKCESGYKLTGQRMCVGKFSGSENC